MDSGTPMLLERVGCRATSLLSRRLSGDLLIIKEVGQRQQRSPVGKWGLGPLSLVEWASDAVGKWDRGATSLEELDCGAVGK